MAPCGERDSPGNQQMHVPRYAESARHGDHVPTLRARTKEEKDDEEEEEEGARTHPRMHGGGRCAHRERGAASWMHQTPV